MKDILNRNGSDCNDIMLWAAVYTCYFGFLRSGEITVSSLSAYYSKSHLTMNNVSVDRAGRPGIIHLMLKASKTDPFRKGVTISLGRTEKPLCPVVALLAYLAARGQSGRTVVSAQRRATIDKGRLCGSSEENAGH